VSTPARYPLDWPAGWPRTPARDRREALFGHASDRVFERGDGTKYTSRTMVRGRTMTQALGALRAELGRLCGHLADAAVISTNVEVRQDGLPYANRRPPEDPGVAVYFRRPVRGGAAQAQCIPCDRFDRVPDNLYAVAKCIEALRGLERWGGRMLDAAFTGFKALPALGTGRPSWSAARSARRRTRSSTTSARSPGCTIPTAAAAASPPRGSR
jgi:hypothetical protein